MAIENSNFYHDERCYRRYISLIVTTMKKHIKFPILNRSTVGGKQIVQWTFTSSTQHRLLRPILNNLVNPAYVIIIDYVNPLGRPLYVQMDQMYGLQLYTSSSANNLLLNNKSYEY